MANHSKYISFAYQPYQPNDNITLTQLQTSLGKSIAIQQKHSFNMSVSRPTRRRLLEHLDPTDNIHHDIKNKVQLPELDVSEPALKRSRISRTRSVPTLPSQSQPSSPTTPVVKTVFARSRSELSSLTGLVWPVSNADLHKNMVDSFNRKDGYSQQQLKLFVDSSNPDRGYGVRTATDIARHTLVCEYAGDLMNQSHAEQLEELYEKAAAGCYMFYFVHGSRHLCIDATSVPDNDTTSECMKYGFGRYINHARKRANLVGRVITDSSSRPRLCFFAKRRIQADEELLIDYGDRDRATLKANPWLKD